MTAVAKIEPTTPQNALSNDVRRMEKQFAMALPEHVTPERFVRVVVTAIQSNPDLQRADRDSVLAAALKCAQDGLLPDGREAALVTYSNKAQYLPMIAGILTKVRRSGELLTIGAHVVYEHDAFSYTLGDDEKIEHQPLMGGGPRGKAVACYAVAKTKDGGIYREVMSIEEINQVRNVSKAKNGGPWVSWWGEMARKTVIRRLAKRLPMSTDLQQVFSRDDDHYDILAQAEGSARLRRLHADFDEPQAPAEIAAIVESVQAVDPPHIDDVPTRDDTFDPADAEDIFPVDQPARADGEANNPPSELGLADASFDPIDWAASFTRGLDQLETGQEVADAWSAAKAKGYALKLKAANPGMFEALKKAVEDKHAEFAAR